MQMGKLGNKDVGNQRKQTSSEGWNGEQTRWTQRNKDSEQPGNPISRPKLPVPVKVRMSMITMTKRLFPEII